MLVTPLGSRIIVRYARKPIWMPTAPSKLFRIPEHTFYSAEEVNQIKVLDKAHKAQIIALSEFFRLEFYIPATQLGGLPKEFVEVENEQERKIYEENDRINAQIAKQRDEYFSKTIQELEEKCMEAKLDKEEELAEIGKRIDAYVKEQLADPNNFVTPDNLNEMLEKAIESPTSYEFFIDRNGKRYKTLSKSNPRDENRRT